MVGVVVADRQAGQTWAKWSENLVEAAMVEKKNTRFGNDGGGVGGYMRMILTI